MTSTSYPRDGVKEKAEQTASTAADEAKHLASVAQEEAGQIVSEAKTQVSAMMHDARTQLEDQSRGRRDQLAQTLRTLSTDLQEMASDRGGLAAQLARDAASQARALGGRIESREPGELLDDLRRLARRKPGTFLLGAMAAGLVAGRFARGTKEAMQEQSSPISGRQSVPTQTTGVEYGGPTPAGAMTSAVPAGEPGSSMPGQSVASQTTPGALP